MKRFSSMISFRRSVTLAWLVLVLFLTAARAGATPAPIAPAGPDFAAIDTYVESQMGAMRIPGLALGIVHGDQIVYLKGYGIDDPTGRVVTPQTPFRIGSISKTFTALAVMQLAEAGKIDLDAPVQRYLPWWHVADAEASAQITMHQLLMMNSGLTDALDGKHWADRDTSEAALEHTVRDLSTEELDRPVLSIATPAIGHSAWLCRWSLANPSKPTCKSISSPRLRCINRLPR